MIPIFTRAMKARFLATLEGLPHGQLTLKTPEGEVYRFGTDGPAVDLHLRDWSVLPRILARGDIGMGEAWIEGHWHTSSLEDLLALALINNDHLLAYAEPGPLQRMKYALIDRVMRLNSLRGAARNIRAHYDVGNEFYQLWLDRGMTYSSALFGGEDMDLEQAQARKNDRILGQLAPGETLLEIGCGWGGFAERASGRGHRVTGLTLSPSQKGYADARLDGRADIRLQDYRQAKGTFDNIVSVEMIEAVGERYWPVYFSTLKQRLAEGGRAVLQVITIPDSEFSLYRQRSDFIRHHTFPGGMLPCEAVLVRETQRAGLTMDRPFAFGQDYARTCRIWASRMAEERPRILRQGRDERFLRGWQFYLESCAATFATGRTDVVQITLTHADAGADLAQAA